MKTLFLCLALSLTAALGADRPNVLFIAIDDLRCELGCYGSKIVKSPNIDKLAGTSVRFDRAYCQQAICGPSRACVMTGLRPDASQIHGNHTHFRDIHPDIVTLPQHFKNHGYHTRSMGKLYHGVFPKGSSRTIADTFGDDPSWSIPTFRPGPRYYYTEVGIEAARMIYQKVYKPKNPGQDDWTRKLVFGPATEAPDVADNILYDGQVADRAVDSIRELANSKEPFFLAVGFIKPHSPYIAPKKYWDLYDAEAISLATDKSRKTDAPSISLHGSGELRRYTDQQKRGPIPESDQRKVRHAYLACVSYIDAQIGRVVNELDRQGLADTTTVALWSDHGYHLGEKNLWGKTTNFELDTRVPMMIRVPGHEPGVCESPVELVDLYPTLSDLAGLPVGEYLQGESLAATLKDPESGGKVAAFSQYSRGKMRGYSVRTKTHRYTEWIDTTSGEISERLLFEHSADPDETTNRIGSAPLTLVTQLARLLDHGEGWRKAGQSRLTLGKPFTNHMVMQRETPVSVWGTANPGAEVKVEFNSKAKQVKVGADGKWSVTFEPQPANSSAQNLTVKTQGETIEISDILIGDIYLCSGQSNMRWMLKQTASGAEAIRNSQNPNLRIMNLASSIHPGSGKFSLLKLRNTFADNLYETNGWQVAGPETVPNFSGVAYYFGQYLQSKTNIPIGLINNSVGGSPMEAWIPGDGNPNRNWLETSDLPKWVKGRAQLNLTHWIANSSSPTPHHPFEPGFLFAAGVKPFVDFPIKAILWYQGESNATEDGTRSPAIDPSKNFQSHSRLIKSWRDAFGREDLPFYFVQLPGLNRDWPDFREVQSKVDLLIPNTHMAVTIDCGHPTNVHPTKKKPVGERLAQLALKHEYKKPVIAEAPRLTGWIQEGERLTLQFNRPVKIDPGASITFAGSDRVFKKMKLTMSMQKVPRRLPPRGHQSDDHGAGAAVVQSKPRSKTFTSPTVQGTVTDLTGYSPGLNPVQSIRYAWENDPKATILCAETGLPVAPFRTDNWPIIAAKSPQPVTIDFSTKDSIYATSFEGVKPGVFTSLKIDGVTWSAKADQVEIDPKHWKHGKQCLHLLGGAKRSVDVQFSKPVPKGSLLQFAAERWTSRSPFEFRIYTLEQPDKWKEIYNGSREVRVGRSFLSQVNLSLSTDTAALRFVSTAPPNSGLLIDNLRIVEPKPMALDRIEVLQPVYPVLIGKPENPVLDVVVNVSGQIGKAPTLSGLRITTKGTDDLNDIEQVRALINGNPIGEPTPPRTSIDLSFPAHSVQPGENLIQVSYRLRSTASLDRHVDATCTAIRFDGKWREIENPSPEGLRRIGFALRNRGQDGVNATRIPGMATTNAGNLIAVYDNRNRAGGDLPGDIDVGMSRSTDGGQTWKPMQVIMDMGNDPKWRYDGIGDPSVLVDRNTGTIWVTATWSHGNRSWHGSGPGVEPEETGQFMLVKSDDDGKTWSKPINITKQIKDPKWRFVLQGPGKGITMRDGTLVFPAQFRGENAAPVSGKPFSTLIYSKDRGATWKIGTGVKIDTTEAQLVELGDGSIMINCRDNRGGSRSIYTTKDLGKTWQAHPTSRKGLPEPVCMASLIRVESKKHGPLLIFSNPAQSRGRANMTIKISNDEGMTWPEKWHTLVDSRFAAYSCMTQIGEDKIGLLYERPGELVFVRYTIDELMGE